MSRRFDMYDDRAKRVLALAQAEAMSLHHDALGPEHLLLGVLCAGAGDRPGSRSTGDVLNSLGLDVVRARQALEAVSGRGDPHKQLDQLPRTPECERAFDQAVNEAELLGAAKVNPKHVLLAVLREPGKAADVLRFFGLSTEAVRHELSGSQ